MAGKPPKAGVWILCAVLFAFAFQGSRHVWDPDEGRYTAVALNMMGSGDWVVPRLHDEHPHFSKPPLTYWAVAASMEIFGKNEWAARLPNTLADLGALLLLFLLGRLVLSERPWAAPLVPYPKDPVALAGAIRKAAGPRVRDVVFVNTKAEYGLSFYTGAGVERVDFGPLSEAPPLVSRPQTVLQELSEKEPERLFLIRPWDRDSFSSRLASAGYKALPLGGFGKYRFFRARKKDT